MIHVKICGEWNKVSKHSNILLYIRWREKYESLYESVEPFKDQLEQFQLEKEQLLGASKNAQSEVEKLSKDYAKLLGHSNQKQKIKHVMKLKEENNELKQVCMIVK